MKNKFMPLIKKQIMKPPFIKLEVSTWMKDSHSLYDYEAQDNKFNTQTFQINRNARVYIHNSSKKTMILFEDQAKQPPMENIYIASIIFDTQKRHFKIQSADVSGVQPHPYLRTDHPDLFRNSYIVIRDYQKQEGVEGYPLDVGNYLKLGRIQYLIIEMSDTKGVRTLKQTTHLELNKDVHVVQQQLKGSCKICLCEEASQTDPLITPCKCKGSCQFVHAGCLKNWINSKVKRQLNGISISYNFSKFQCQICKTLLPKMVKFMNNTQVQMITFQKPTKPYLVLESVTQKHQRRQQLKQRNLHVISPQLNNPVKLGRGQQCQIKITDISVSRVHAQIRFENDKFYAKDLKSKFGTLVKFRQQLILEQEFSLQNGRSCFDFILKGEHLTQKDLIAEQLANRPIFYTRKQLKQRGQISGQEQY